MKNIKYKKYSKIRMKNIIRKEGFLFIETSLNDNYIIRKKDLADFIVLEAERTNYAVDMSVYMPGIDEPVLTTFGCFLDKANPLLRREIIHRLKLLQTRKKRPKKVKIFDINKFNRMSANEMGIENGKVKNFDKFYRKYVKAQNIHNIKMEGV